MTAQFGRWNFDSAPMPASLADRVGDRLGAWGPEGRFRYQDSQAELLWFPFETTEHRSVQQPMVLASGEVLLWDGRLDNGREILGAIGISGYPLPSDVEIVAAVWSRWGLDCLARLIGDWAFSLWMPRDRRLLLAADILASRHLCYAINEKGVRWSSIPDPQILLPGGDHGIDEEYLAGWLGSFPAAHLTPFRAIRRVPPASFVTIRPGSATVRRYWDFDATRRICHARDAEYEEHFLELFRQSVHRRLRSNWPVLAELSGGMDSSAIVCVADALSPTRQETKIDTVSWYNDDEPHWDERPWFTRIESHRGKSGLHVDAKALPSEAENQGSQVRLRPGAGSLPKLMLEMMIGRGHRVLLSGIGGDEFMGGVPTPLPELEELLACGRFIRFWQRTLVWALTQRRPWIHLFSDTVRGFLPLFLCQRKSRQIPWILPDFALRQGAALGGYRRRLRLTGPRPVFQENMDALEGIRRQLGCVDPHPELPFERRFPFLDRDLLEFLFAIPREQLIRPGQRRSLMRRALRGTVPDAILDRRRKAFVSRSPLRRAEEQLRTLSPLGPLASEKAGIVDSSKYRGALAAVCAGADVPVLPLLRTLALEQWLAAIEGRESADSQIGTIGLHTVADSPGNHPITDIPGAGEVIACEL